MWNMTEINKKYGTLQDIPSIKVELPSYPGCDTCVNTTDSAGNIIVDQNAVVFGTWYNNTGYTGYIEDKDGADYYFNYITRNTTVTPPNQPISDMMVGFINLYFYSGLNPAYYPLTRVEVAHPSYPVPPKPPTPPAPSSSHTGLIVFLVILFIAIGGGAAYWFYKRRQ